MEKKKCEVYVRSKPHKSRCFDPKQSIEKEVAEKLREIPGVTEIWEVYGVYDIVVRVEVESISELKGFLGTGIRRVHGVRSTLTMIVVD